MRPADETPAIPISEPANSAATGPACQDRSRRQKVLLVDTDQQHAECVRAGLSFHDFAVYVCFDPEHAAMRLRRAGNDFDLVILNVSSPSLLWVNILAKLQSACFESGVYPSPLFLCTSITKRPPEFELRIERMGARYVFEG